MNSPEEIKETAAEYCKGRLVLVEQDIFVNNCPVLQNARVTYQCLPLEGAQVRPGNAAPRN